MVCRQHDHDYCNQAVDDSTRWLMPHPLAYLYRVSLDVGFLKITMKEYCTKIYLVRKEHKLTSARLFSSTSARHAKESIDRLDALDDEEEELRAGFQLARCLWQLEHTMVKTNLVLTKWRRSKNQLEELLDGSFDGESCPCCGYHCCDFTTDSLTFEQLQKQLEREEEECSALYEECGNDQAKISKEIATHLGILTPPSAESSPPKGDDFMIEYVLKNYCKCSGCIFFYNKKDLGLFGQIYTTKTTIDSGGMCNDLCSSRCNCTIDGDCQDMEHAFPENAPLQFAALTLEEDAVATPYKAMIKMGMPYGEVIQHMSKENVPQHIRDAVLGVDDPFLLKEFPAKAGTSFSEERESITFRSFYCLECYELMQEQKERQESVKAMHEEIITSPCTRGETETSAEKEKIGINSTTKHSSIAERNCIVENTVNDDEEIKDRERNDNFEKETKTNTKKKRRRKKKKKKVSKNPPNPSPSTTTSETDWEKVANYFSATTEVPNLTLIEEEEKSEDPTSEEASIHGESHPSGTTTISSSAASQLLDSVTNALQAATIDSMEDDRNELWVDYLWKTGSMIALDRYMDEMEELYGT